MIEGPRETEPAGEGPAATAERDRQSPDELALELTATRRHLEASLAERDALADRLLESERANALLETRAHRDREELMRLTRSLSWRVTAPIRYAGRLRRRR